MRPREAARLSDFMTAKAIVEALFVGALAVGFYLTAFNPYFRGALDVADSRNVAGWVVDQSDPRSHVEVQLYVDGRFSGSAFADLARADVLAAGRAEDELHGFKFDTPPLPAGEHEAQVYAVHASGQGERRTLQLIGRPRVFRVAAE